MPTEREEEYLETICKLQQMKEVIGTTRLSEALKISPASVTEMVKKLGESGMVVRTENEGIGLTPQGNKKALNIIRKHRLSERFFTDVLKLPWDEVHEEACRFEHVLSDRVADALETFLSHPATCPHGHPIPSKRGKTLKDDAVPLTSLRPSQSGVVSRISEESHEFLRYLAALGLMPQARVRVEQVAPFEGPLLVQVGGASYALGRDVAGKIFVRGVKG
jgi:DtxR family Mn-dependent transcriptional regulator